MGKVDSFCKVLDSLNDDEKDKLLASAKRLLTAQKVVRVNPAKTKSSNRGREKRLKNSKHA